MYLLKLFSVSLYLFTGIADAGVLGKRKSCDALVRSKAGCRNSDGKCVQGVSASCHDYYLWLTCYCSAGEVWCDDPC